MVEALELALLWVGAATGQLGVPLGTHCRYEGCSMKQNPKESDLQEVGTE